MDQELEPAVAHLKREKERYDRGSERAAAVKEFVLAADIQSLKMLWRAIPLEVHKTLFLALPKEVRKVLERPLPFGPLERTEPSAGSVIEQPVRAENKNRAVYRRNEMGTALLSALRKNAPVEFTVRKAYRILKADGFSFRGRDKAWDVRALGRVVLQLSRKGTLRVVREKKGSENAIYTLSRIKIAPANRPPSGYPPPKRL